MTDYTKEKRSKEPIHVLLLRLYILKQTVVNKAHTGFSMDNTTSNKLGAYLHHDRSYHIMLRYL